MQLVGSHDQSTLRPSLAMPDTALPMKQSTEDGAGDVNVHSSQWVVGNEQRGFVVESTSYVQPGLLPTRQRVSSLTDLAAQPPWHQLQVPCKLGRFEGGHQLLLVEVVAHDDVVEHGAAENHGTLRNIGCALATPRAGPIHGGQAPHEPQQQRRLARGHGPDNRQGLTPADRKAQAGQQRRRFGGPGKGHLLQRGGQRRVRGRRLVRHDGPLQSPLDSPQRDVQGLEYHERLRQDAQRQAQGQKNGQGTENLSRRHWLPQQCHRYERDHSTQWRGGPSKCRITHLQCAVAAIVPGFFRALAILLLKVASFPATKFDETDPVQDLSQKRNAPVRRLQS
mmetsp:Transcript_63182/g.179669  ORF Transcript_63182/g.179669 Transcript_63182/m.179669 type:complete len:337 (-) Transcript_63182:862-1872(-)